MFLGEETAPGARAYPKEKGISKMFTVPSLPQKVTFIQRREKKKKRKKMTRCPSLGSLPSPLLLLLSPPRTENPGWGEVAGQPLSDEVSNIEGHLLNGGVVEGLNVSKSPLVFFCNHVNSHTFAAKTSTPTNSVDIVFPVGGKVIVDD